jgi:preprotein translocase subunit SecA
MEYLAEAVDSLIDTHCVSDATDEWDLDGLARELGTFWPSTVTSHRLEQCADTDEMYDLVMADASIFYAARETEMGETTMREIERQVMLRIIDQRWREHLEEMDYLQEGINLRAMGQKDPLTEWQREGFEMFGTLMKGIAQDFVKYVMHVQVVKNESPVLQVSNLQESAFDAETDGGFAAISAEETGVPVQSEPAVKTIVKSADDWSTTPRNAVCPCGSGKKYKLCHGRN